MPSPWNHAGSPRRRTLPCQARLQSLAAPNHRNVALSSSRRTSFFRAVGRTLVPGALWANSPHPRRQPAADTSFQRPVSHHLLRNIHDPHLPPAPVPHLRRRVQSASPWRTIASRRAAGRRGHYTMAELGRAKLPDSFIVVCSLVLAARSAVCTESTETASPSSIWRCTSRSMTRSMTSSGSSIPARTRNWAEG